jgi:hypothetical protein
MIVRITPRQIVGTLVISAFSFLLGFTASRYLIDVTLREASKVLLRSAKEYEQQEHAVMRQFAAEYNALERQLAAIRARKVEER